MPTSVPVFPLKFRKTAACKFKKQNPAAIVFKCVCVCVSLTKKGLCVKGYCVCVYNSMKQRLCVHVWMYLCVCKYTLSWTIGKNGWINLNGNSLFRVALKALAAYRGPYLKQVLEGVDSFIRALFLSRYRYSTNSYVRTGLFNSLRLMGHGHDSNTLRKPQEWIIILQSIVQAEGAF